MQYTYVLFVQIFGDKKNNLYKIVELEEPNMDQILQKNSSNKSCAILIHIFLRTSITLFSENLSQSFFNFLALTILVVTQSSSTLSREYLRHFKNGQTI